VKKLRKKRVLIIVVGSVFIYSFILALMYPVISTRYRGKIHFLMSPNPHAFFIPPMGKADFMFVWVSVMKDSTYGSFNMALVAYETYNVEGDHHYYEYHWYTDNLRAGEIYAYPIDKTSAGIPIVWEYDVTIARIDVTASEHQLNATVIVKGKTLFTAGFWANTSAPIQSRVVAGNPEGIPSELFLSVEAYRPTLKALVTGVEVGDFTGGHFDYIDTELIDSSLLYHQHNCHHTVQD